MCAGRSSRGAVAAAAAPPAKGAPAAPTLASESPTLDDKYWFFDKVNRFRKTSVYVLHIIQPITSTHAICIKVRLNASCGL